MHFAVAWAGLRVIIQGITNLSTFLQKLMDSLVIMANDMAYFSRVRDHIIDSTSTPTAIKHILDAAYNQLLLYLTGIIWIFYQTGGGTNLASKDYFCVYKLACCLGRKSNARILAKAVWKPFRLTSTLATLKELKVRLRDEMTLLTLGRSSRPSGKNDTKDPHDSDENQCSFRDRLRHWIAPPAFTDAYDHAIQQRTPRTSKWLINNMVFSSWYASSRSGDPLSFSEGSEERPPFWIFGKFSW
ncbi:hypothetical protein F5Y15DRAFT_177670 [Xylariaceae sp. FL0016]|nr:hypothetical protein F5Y15DRAFT_177670 [Xylariaceae sp. FL0016]